MSAAQHASIDQISDLVAGLLPAQDAVRLNAHLTGCEVCTGQRERLAAVTELLRAEASTSPPMPAAVANRIDAALRSAAAERAAGVSSIDRGRTPSLRSAPARRRLLGVLAGAAAAVVVVGLGWSIVHDAVSGNGGSATSVNAARGAAPGSGNVRPNAEKGNPSTSGQFSGPTNAEGGLLPVNRSNLADVARRLASGRTPAAALAEHCRPPNRDGLTSVVRWSGRPATIVVDKGHHRVWVVGCQRPDQVLAATAY